MQLQVDWMSGSREGGPCVQRDLEVTFCQAARLPDREWAQTLTWATAVHSCLRAFVRLQLLLVQLQLPILTAPRQAGAR